MTETLITKSRPAGHLISRAAGAICAGVLVAGSSAEETAGTEARHHHPEGIREHDHHIETSPLPIGFSLSFAWDSRYVSEGRDNLDGDGLLGTTLELSWEGFNLGAWYADSPDGPYDEFNSYLEYGWEAGDFAFYVGYTYLRFMNAGGHDHEVGAGVAYNGFDCGIVPALDAYYSFDASGAFFELSFTRAFEVAPWLTLEPGIVFGINQGYIADGHEGGNHVAAALSATVPVSEQVEIGAYVSYNWAIGSDPLRYADDAALKDFLFGGVTLTLSF